MNIHWKDWCWSWSSNILATWCKEPAHWKRTLMLGKIEDRRRDDRGWDGWMASLAQWTWVWASSRSCWWTGKPGECSPWCCKELDMTEWLNNNNKKKMFKFIRNCQTIFQNFCTILLSHQQWTRIHAALHPCYE